MHSFSSIRQLFRKRPGIHNDFPVLIGNSSIHDRGVFASRTIHKGEWIEIAPLVPVPADQFALIRGTSLHFSYFLTGNDAIPAVLGLGYASLYNHASPAAASYSIDLHSKAIRIRACRNIQAGEEITINYNGKPDDQTPVRFAAIA